MAELYHLGIDAGTVPELVVIAEPEFRGTQWPPNWPARELGRRREFNSVGLEMGGLQVLVCIGSFGAPAAVIAVEELARAGARRMLAVSLCRCPGCVTAPADHPITVVMGAERHEATSADYAPMAYPAVPDASVLQALRAGLPDAPTAIVRTVDVLPEWTGTGGPAATGIRIDLMTSAVLVAARACGISAGSCLIGAATAPAERARLVADAVRALCASANRTSAGNSTSTRDRASDAAGRP